MENTIPLLIALDATFEQIIALYGFPAFLSRPSGFESLSLIILEQQVSLNSARASFNKLKGLIGNFTPEAITQVTEQQFRQCGISRQKTTYLRALAEAVLDGAIDFDSFSDKNHELVRAELVRLKGIGNWTADIYLMFCLQSPDILPLADIGIVSAIRDLWGFTTAEEIAEYSKRWKPYGTTAAFLLWHYYLEKRGRKFPH